MIPGCSTNMKHVISLVGACLSAALLAACGGGHNVPSPLTPMSVAPQIGSPHSAAVGSAWRPLTSNGYKLLYAFKGAPDGGIPSGNLVAVKDALYGATSSGGSGICPPSPSSSAGCGTVFKMTRAGHENVLYSFKGRKFKDGASPDGLLNVDGTFYGTTFGDAISGRQCGDYHTGCGAVFEMSLSGKEHVLYRFKGEPDGRWPLGLMALNGALYGTTYSGGTECASIKGGCGTVFEVTTSGKERVLYSFKGGRDGAGPGNSLIAVNGKLYGVTSSGGGSSNNGVVFVVSTSGKEHVLYRFKGGRDGEFPDGLLNVNGTLYGTTQDGGAYRCHYDRCGTVFELSDSGTENVLYRFKGGTDGADPNGLININGALYGTTYEGGYPSGCYVGGSPSGYYVGCGTVFEMSTSGEEHVLYRFGNGSTDGIYPDGNLTELNGVLYGTTAGGGSSSICTVHYFGCGTVFRISASAASHRKRLKRT